MNLIDEDGVVYVAGKGMGELIGGSAETNVVIPTKVKELDLSAHVSPLDAINAVYLALNANHSQVFSPATVKSVAMQSVQ